MDLQQLVEISDSRGSLSVSLIQPAGPPYVILAKMLHVLPQCRPTVCKPWIRGRSVVSLTEEGSPVGSLHLLKLMLGWKSAPSILILFSD